MPLVYQSSDVYIEERDLSAEARPPATSIGALVMASRRGRLGRNKVTSPDKFIAEYGVPDASIGFGHYAAIAFLRQAQELYVNRVVGPGATFGGLVLQKRVAAPIDAVPVFRGFTIGDPQDIDFSDIASSTNLLENLLAIYNNGPGSYSETRSARLVSKNLTVPQNVQAADFSTVGVMIAGYSVDGNIQPGNYGYTVTAFNEIGETLASVVASVNIANTDTSVYLSWNPVPGATGYSVYGRTNGTDGRLAVLGGGDLFFVDYGSGAPDATKTPPVSATTTDEFTLEIYDTEVSVSQPAESFNCCFTEKVNGLGQQLEVEQAVNGLSDYITVKSNASSFAPGALPVVYTTARIPLAAGSSGSAVTSSHIMLGWNEFRDPEKTDVRLLINGGYSIPSVQLRMDDIAKARADAVAILDMPANRQKAQAAVDYRNIDLNLNSNRSAIYTPDLLIEDEYNGKTLFVPPSGHVAGVYAHTDNVTYPWFAPAGLNRGLVNVLKLRQEYDRGERDMLWRAQINYIRNFQGLGRAVWEQRTMQSLLSGFSFVNVRRLMDYIALSVRPLLYSKEFEPNDDYLRRDIVTTCERLLAAVQQARGINKFLVICDNRNNPAFITAQGQLNVDIFVEPTLPAEKIRVRLNLTKQGVDFQEVLATSGL